MASSSLLLELVLYVTDSNPCSIHARAAVHNRRLWELLVRRPDLLEILLREGRTLMVLIRNGFDCKSPSPIVSDEAIWQLIV
jgi:hypothetical protein